MQKSLLECSSQEGANETLQWFKSMISDAHLPELRRYRRLEDNLPIEMADDFGKLVVANSNDSAPIHRWFRFKEGFSADLLGTILQGNNDKMPEGTISFLDPFCGVGTSLVSAQELSTGNLKILAVGIERNPFIHFVAKAKVMWPQANLAALPQICTEVLASSDETVVEFPDLSSLYTGRCMTRYVAAKLLAVRDALHNSGDSAAHRTLLVGLASAIEPLSRVRKDGRALRIVGSRRRRVQETLQEKWQTIISDVKFMQNTVGASEVPRIIRGDGRFPLKAGIQADSIDLIVTSPPYPNNIDYSEVYKLETWLLGFVRSQEAFLKLRKSTFRSHPTCAVPDVAEEFQEHLKSGSLRSSLSPLLKKLSTHPEKWRHRLILGYFADMWSALQQQYVCLKKGGRAFLVVGNSLHGTADSPYLVPTDIAVSLIGEAIGFKVDRVIVARNLKRRLSGNHFLRESIVALRK
jgi:hypothetical protein